MRNLNKNTFEVPRRPEPMCFSVRVKSDGGGRYGYYPLGEELREYEYLKRMASRALAEKIFENCQLFEIQNLGFEGVVLQMELTVSDRGTYENYTQVAKAEGREAGRIEAVRQMAASLPWGLAEATTEYYE